MPVTKGKSSWQTTVWKSRSNRSELLLWVWTTEAGAVHSDFVFSYPQLLGMPSRGKPRVAFARAGRSGMLLEGTTVLDDQVNVLSVLKHADVGEWIAVDRQDVGTHSHGNRPREVTELTATRCDRG